MRLTIGNLSNRILVDEHDRPLYKISGNVFWQSKYRVEKFTSGEKLVPLATLSFGCFTRDKIKFPDGSKVRAKDWLRRSSRWSSTRKFVSKSGTPYKWSSSYWGSQWTLYKQMMPADRAVATSHGRSFGLFGGGAHKAYLDIDDGVLPDLDDIVVSFVYMRVSQRRRQQASANAAASSGAAGS